MPVFNLNVTQESNFQPKCVLIYYVALKIEIRILLWSLDFIQSAAWLSSCLR